MGKATTYLLVMSGLMLLFYFGGLIEQSGSVTSTLLTLVVNPENLQYSFFVTSTILGALSLGAAIVVGVLTKDVQLAAMFTITSYLLNLGWDFLQVFGVIAGENRVIAVLIFAPLMFIYVITMVEFWRGTD